MGKDGATDSICAVVRCDQAPVRRVEPFEPPRRSLVLGVIVLDPAPRQKCPNPVSFLPPTIKAMTPPVSDLEDPRRTEPPYVSSEREMLERWLDFQRATLLLKCEGVVGGDLRYRPVATSKLSLHGLVRHMAEVERSWFRRCLLRDLEAPYLFIGADGGWDLEFEPLENANWQEDLRTWQFECEASRRATVGLSLDEMGLHQRHAVSLRWIFVHMIEEYARHNGHADLIREMVDGRVGW